MDDKDIYKIVVLDNCCSGKTNLINRYVLNEYNNNEIPRLAQIYLEKSVELNNGKKIIVQLWDTIGRDKYIYSDKKLTKGAKGLIFLYNISNRNSFNEIKSYFYDIKQGISDNVVLALVGNHLDVDDEDDNDNNYSCRKITTNEGQNFAEENNLLFYEVSAKDGTNVNEFFDELIQRIYENIPNAENDNRILK